MECSERVFVCRIEVVIRLSLAIKKRIDDEDEVRFTRQEASKHAWM